MSLFFKGEKAVSAPVLPTPDLEAALDAVAANKTMVEVAAIGGLQPGDAENLIAECRRVDGLVTAALADDTVTDEAGAVAFVQSAAGEGFPADRFVAVMVDNVGTPEKSATWADVSVAAKAELNVGGLGKLPGGGAVKVGG